MRALSDEAVKPSLLGEALAEADRAILLAPDLGIAHAARASAFRDQGRYRDSLAEYALAEDLAPGDAFVAMSAGKTTALLSAGINESSLAGLKRAIQLDPLSPFGYLNLALALYDFRRYDDALVAVRHLEELEPSVKNEDISFTGLIALAKGDPQTARKTCSAGRNYLEHFCLAQVYYALGMSSQGSSEFEKVRVELGDRGADIYADISAKQGKIAEAVHWLAVAYEFDRSDLIDMRLDPALDSVRDTPEYKEIVRKMNFPP